MKYLFFLLLGVLGNPIVADHEFHISKCEIAYNEAEEAIQISLNIFIDDLEEALATKDIKNLSIGTDKESLEAEQHIIAYLQEQFEIEVDGKRLSYQFLGKELSEDLQAVWCYLEIEKVASIHQLKVRNQILTQLFTDQKNIISITSTEKGRKGYFLFDNKTFEDTVFFK